MTSAEPPQWQATGLAKSQGLDMRVAAGAVCTLAVFWFLQVVLRVCVVRPVNTNARSLPGKP